MKSNAKWVALSWLLLAAALATIGARRSLWPTWAQVSADNGGAASVTATPTHTLAQNLTATSSTLTFTPAMTETIIMPTATETLTPTISATPTLTPTPRPVYLPLVLKLRRSLFLLNGGFESGAFLPGWQESGTLAREVTQAQRHSGSYAALLGSPYYPNHGGCPVGEAAIHQLVDVPASGHPFLRFWYYICSYDLLQFDYFAAYVAVWPNGAPNQVWMDGRPSWDDEIWCSEEWREAVIPLDIYLGQTITIKLTNAMTNADGWYNTWTYVDDVRLEERP